MHTVFISPSHVLPETVEMPTHRDDVGGGAAAFRRRWIRGLRRWEVMVPGRHEALDSLMGLLEYAQGDTPIWFDGAGMLEVIEPILIGEGDGVTTDFILPHRWVFVASTVIYQNDALLTAWTPLGGDGVVMDSFRCTAAPAANAQLKAKYRRKAKVIVMTEEQFSRERSHRMIMDQSQTVERIKVSLEEVPI